MEAMERRLVKAGIYGFILGICLAVLFCPDKVTVQSSPGVYSSEAVPLREYILSLLRFAIKLCLGTVVAVWVYDRFLRTPAGRPGEPSFWSGFFKSFFIVLGLIIVATLIFSAVGQYR